MNRKIEQGCKKIILYYTHIDMIGTLKNSKQLKVMS